MISGYSIEDGEASHPLWALMDTLAFAGLLVVVLAAPLPLGGNRPWAIAGLVMAVWCFLLMAMPFAASDRAVRQNLRRTAVPLALVAGLSALMAVQLLSGQPQGQAPGTLSRHDTRLYQLCTLMYLGAMLLVIVTVRSRRRCLWVLGAVLAAGMAQAALGILLLRLGGNYELFFQPFEAGGRASGTFANPNHFAGYLAMSLAAGIGLLIAQYEGGVTRDGWRPQLTAWLRFMLSAKMLLRLFLLVLVIAMVLSHSRLGNLAFFVALMMAGLVLAARSKKMRRPALLLVSTMMIIDLLVIGQWVGFDRIAERFQATDIRAPTEAVPNSAPASTGSDDPLPPKEESIEERLQVPALSLKLVERRPFFGYGGGTFHLAFAPVKPDWVYAGYWTNAHNDFVEVAVNLGLLGLALWLGVGLLSALAAWHLITDRQPRLNRGVGVAVLIAIIASSLQSVMEFALHIPANALTLSILLALSWLAGGLPLDNTRGKPGLAA